MAEYEPEKFRKTFLENDGAALWAFLNEPLNVARMETATYLTRPAAEPISPYLTMSFGDWVKADQIKRMLGHMIKQIMESRGHMWERDGVRIRSRDNIFKTASRYTWAYE